LFGKIESAAVSDFKANEPRRHHYVPRCWLAGFTETGEKDGKLWVTDLGRRKQWQTSPGNIGFINDFYRLSDAQIDPVIVEKAFSQIEGAVAPILKSLDREQRAPGIEEFSALLPFIALQWARVPSFRPMVFKVLNDVTRGKLAVDLANEESWKKALKKAGITEDAPGASYESMMEFYQSGRYSLKVQTEWYIQQTFEAAEYILPSLSKRSWRATFSSSGSFVGSDNPVILDGPKGKLMGFKNAEIIIYALSRHVLLYSTLEPISPIINRKYIAHMNTLSLLRAEQVFSHVSEFCWLDENRNYQTDWTLFSKEKY
jgi:hypothetical protein